MQYKGVSKKFTSESPRLLIQEVKEIFNEYPHALSDSLQNLFIKQAVSHFSLDSYDPVLVRYSNAGSVVELKDYSVNQVLEVITSTSVLGQTVFDRGLPMATFGLFGVYGTLGALPSLHTYLESRGQLANTVKDIRGHLKFDYDPVEGKLYLRDSISGDIGLLLVLDYRLEDKQWLLADYQRAAFVANTVQYLNMKNADILGKASMYGVTAQIDVAAESDKYKAMRDEYQSYASMLFLGSVD